ncbi:MAG: hypothetical protein DRJ05_19305 [Bacteroidetes bacterium]|nr:MAG: hypothetical protein DRJ05_19305 [Bacteroidota bacterium]
MKSLRIILLLLFAFNLSVKAQDVECFILKAPEKPFYDIKKVGVLEFECETNRHLNKRMTDFLIADLIKQNRGIYNKSSNWYGLKKGKDGHTFVKGVKTDFYQVIEREQLEKILKEQRLSLSGVLDEASAAEVGQLLGLDVIIMGSVTYSNVDKRTGTEYPCLERITTAKGTLKMVSVLTAQIVGTKSAEATVSMKKCTDNRSEIPDVVTMAGSAMKILARKFTNYFAPGYQYVEYNFEKIKLKEFKTKSKEAMGFIENGDLDRAFPIVYAMFEADSYNPKTAYNLGVLYEMVGANPDAYEYYNMAYELDYTNKKFSEATQRAQLGIAVNEYLEEIGRPVEPYTFTGGGAAGALADRVEMKGSNTDRINIYELPDKGSDVVAKVPGGLEFKVVEKSGSFYKIQLRGEKTGFVHKSDAK